eukprot:403343254
MNFAQIEKQMRKIKDIESHINYYYNPRAICIKGHNKHQYIKEIMKDLKYDADVYEQNPFKKYVNQTLKKENDTGKKSIRDLVEQTKSEIFQKSQKNQNDSGLDQYQGKREKRSDQLQKVIDRNQIHSQNIEEKVQRLGNGLASHLTSQQDLKLEQLSNLNFQNAGMTHSHSDRNLSKHELKLKQLNDKRKSEDQKFHSWLRVQSSNAKIQNIPALQNLRNDTEMNSYNIPAKSIIDQSKEQSQWVNHYKNLEQKLGHSQQIHKPLNSSQIEADDFIYKIKKNGNNKVSTKKQIYHAHIIDLSSIVDDQTIPSIQFNFVPMDEEGFLLLNSGRLSSQKIYEKDALKNLNPKDAFTWLTSQGQEYTSKLLNNHTLKIEVYSALTQEKLLSRYIHLQEYNHSNLPKICLEIMFSEDIKFNFPSAVQNLNLSDFSGQNEDVQNPNAQLQNLQPGRNIVFHKKAVSSPFKPKIQHYTNYNVVQNQYFEAYRLLLQGNRKYNTETLIQLLQQEQGIQVDQINSNEVLVEFRNAMVQIKGFQPSDIIEENSSFDNKDELPPYLQAKSLYKSQSQASIRVLVEIQQEVLSKWRNANLRCQ